MQAAGWPQSKEQEGLWQVPLLRPRNGSLDQAFFSASQPWALESAENPSPREEVAQSQKLLREH